MKMTKSAFLDQKSGEDGGHEGGQASFLVSGKDPPSAPLPLSHTHTRTHTHSLSHSLGETLLSYFIAEQAFLNISISHQL